MTTSIYSSGLLSSLFTPLFLFGGVSYPERGYDLFLTAAVADGAKLWDLRQDGRSTWQSADK